MSTVAIVQARVGSTRLRGKVLMDIDGKPMLLRVVERLRRAALLDEICVATTEGAEDDAVAELCERADVAVVRGSAHDVLLRYQKAAAELSADTVVRITSDCPLIDPDEVDRVVLAFADQQADLASNVIERMLPRGLDTEVVGARALARASREANEPHQREHVTPFLYEHPELFRVVSVPGQPMTSTLDLSALRWTVDTDEDLAAVRALYANGAGAMGWRAIVGVIEGDPALAQINQHVKQKDLKDTRGNGS